MRSSHGAFKPADIDEMPIRDFGAWIDAFGRLEAMKAGPTEPEESDGPGWSE